ncbi:MAG: hypothetical protein M1831_002216 [Alyxoria varia]|nr:MAG: hypothetical protein M1831_002216 [Alyxoria varia]
MLTNADPNSHPRPVLDDEKAATVLDMLCSVLAPIARRRTHVTPSKGVRAKKRKRKQQDSNEGSSNVESPSVSHIESKVTIGFNSTTRHLENLAASAMPSTLACPPGSSEVLEPVDQAEDDTKDRPSHVDAVFLTGPFNSLLHAHLPMLCYTASTANPELPQTRLVLLGASADPKIAEAMGLPRVGVFGLLSGANETESLMACVRENLPPVEVPWLKEAASAKYMDLRVETTK